MQDNFWLSIVIWSVVRHGAVRFVSSKSTPTSMMFAKLQVAHLGNVWTSVSGVFWLLLQIKELVNVWYPMQDERCTHKEGANRRTHLTSIFMLRSQGEPLELNSMTRVSVAGHSKPPAVTWRARQSNESGPAGSNQIVKDLVVG